MMMKNFENNVELQKQIKDQRKRMSEQKIESKELLRTNFGPEETP
jgi:hypothetical protein